MKRKKRIIWILILVGYFMFFTPVWLLRLVGYQDVIKTDLYPQWINNQELVYLKLVSYSDQSPAGWGMYLPGDPFIIKSSNADFFIYKVNVNNLDKKN